VGCLQTCLQINPQANQLISFDLKYFYFYHHFVLTYEFFRNIYLLFVVLVKKKNRVEYKLSRNTLAQDVVCTVRKLYTVDVLWQTSRITVYDSLREKQPR